MAKDNYGDVVAQIKAALNAGTVKVHIERCDEGIVDTKELGAFFDSMIHVLESELRRKSHARHLLVIPIPDQPNPARYSVSGEIFDFVDVDGHARRVDVPAGSIVISRNFAILLASLWRHRGAWPPGATNAAGGEVFGLSVQVACHEALHSFIDSTRREIPTGDLVEAGFAVWCEGITQAATDILRPLVVERMGIAGRASTLATRGDAHIYPEYVSAVRRVAAASARITGATMAQIVIDAAADGAGLEALVQLCAATAPRSDAKHLATAVLKHLGTVRPLAEVAAGTMGRTQTPATTWSRHHIGVLAGRNAVDAIERAIS